MGKRSRLVARFPKVRVGTVTLLRAPLERTLSWVAYHLNSGIDEMHLFFDDPADPAFEQLQGHPGVHPHRCDDRFWADWGQVRRRPSVPARQMSILRRLLRKPPAGLDWLVHIDSDELLWAERGLRSGLERALAVPAPHVQFLPMEAIPPEPHMSDPFRQVRLFKQLSPDREEWARRLGARAAFRGHRFFRSHVKGKPAVRLDGSITSMRIHGPAEMYRRKQPFDSVVSDAVRVLHYDACSFAEWQDKWSDRLDDPIGSMTRARRRQQRRFRRASRRADPGRLQELYRREYMLSHWEAGVLRTLGMVRKVTVPAGLFELPSRPVSPYGSLAVPTQRAGGSTELSGSRPRGRHAVP